MLVSVIVTTYNRSALLARAVDSVLAQTHEELEIVVVDDGSSDDTADVVAERFGGEPRVVYVQQANGGLSSARNRGLAVAKGDVIAFLDDDDVWRPWKLELQLGCLRRVPEAGMLWTNLETVGADGSPIDGSSLRDMLSAYRRFTLDELFPQRIPLREVDGTPPALRDGSLYVGDVYSKMTLGNLVASSAVITRERLSRAGTFDETQEPAGGDLEFYLRASREGVVGFVDVPAIVCHVGRTDQLTHPSRSLSLARNHLRTMETALARDADRIDLPLHTVRAARARAHSWAGRAYLDAGDVRRARRHLLTALRHGSRDPRTLSSVPLTLLPPPLARRGLQLFRDVAHWLRRRIPRKG